MSQDKVDEENRLVEVKEDEAKLETLPVEVAGPKDQLTGMSLSGSRDPEETMMADGVARIVTVSQTMTREWFSSTVQGGKEEIFKQAELWRCWFYSSERSWTRWTM